jgi:hypothetical protein
LGGLGGGGGEGLVEGETSAEWLDVTVFPPDGDPTVARRTIFDRVGTAMRESGVVDPYVILPAEFVDLGDGAGAQYLPARAMRTFTISGATPNLKLVRQELGLDEVGAISMVTGVFEGARALLGAELAASLGSLGFPDAPAVTSLLAEPTATGTIMGIDIWHRPFGTLRIADVQPSIHPATLAGVIPHAVERAIMEGDGASAQGPAVTPVSVGAVFEAAAAQGIPTRLLAGSLPANVPYDAESQLLLRQGLDAGRLVIVPERPVDLGGRPRLGWWLLDPVSGAAVDQMDDGGGQQIAQTAIVGSIIILAGLIGIYVFAHQILCDTAIAAALLENGFDPRAIARAVGVKLECGATGQNPSDRRMTPVEKGPIPEKDWKFGPGGPATPIKPPPRTRKR